MPAPLAGLLPEEIASTLSLHPPYRGKQIFKSLWTGTDDFSSMTDLPKPLRERLSETSRLVTSSVDGRWEDDDGSVKYRLRLEDGSALEAVSLRDSRGRTTLCLSTQVGCAMGCRFCATAAMGFHRNAAPHEMSEQVLIIRREAGGPSNIVFMGMGEPLLNLDNLRRTVRVLTHPLGLSLSPRRITVSTCGIAGGIRELADAGPPVRLAVSLQTADSALRERLMPAARSNPLDELKEALVLYQQRTGRRVTLEVVLLEGVNDRDTDAESIARFARGLRVAVNLIPWNPVDGPAFRAPSGRRVTEFRSSLEARGLRVTQRYRRGRGVRAACGQLYALQDRADPTHPG